MQQDDAAQVGGARFSGSRAEVGIIGAGPAGLAAALGARADGAETVVVVDRLPGYSRSRSVILDREVLMLLEEWGVSLDGISPADTFTYVHGYGGTQHAESMPFPRFDPGRRAHKDRVEPRPNDILFNRLPAAVLRIRDLEQAMLAEARRQGIEVHFDAFVSGKPAIRPDSVRLEYDDNDGRKAIDCDYLVIADGSRSPVNQMLGNDRIPCEMRSHRYTCSVLESSRRDVLLFWVPRHPSGITEITGLGNGAQYTLVSRLPASFADSISTDAGRSRLAAMIAQAAESIGIKGSIVDGPMPFSTEMDRLEEVAIHRRVLCVGDAARKGDPGFGGNLNEAIRDGRRFGAYFNRASGDQAAADAALHEFRVEVQGATTALQTGGALTNNLRDFFAFGDAAQSVLPEPVRSILHFDVGVMMKATGTIINLLNSSVRSNQGKR
ncbi:MAG TPA: FAD-dependent monooxygenase [Gammaproteobacteria bacterium]